MRGYLTIGGRTLARHQLGIALAFGCTRVVVLTEGLTGEVLTLQHAAEEGGARFHVITSAHALLPLITADDELIVLSDGLFALPEVVLSHLSDGPGVLALPVEAGVAAGFERIDINHAAAGVMRLPGRLIAGLGDLPSDWNAHAALLRLAVQARTPMRQLPSAVLNDGRWGLVRSEDEAHRVEPAWIRLHTRSAQQRSPGEWLAAKTVHMAGPALLHAGTRPWLVAMGAVVLLLLAVGAGWFGWCTPGFVLLGMGWVVAQVATQIAGIETASLLALRDRSPIGPAFAFLIDAAFVTLAAWRSDIASVAGVSFAATWFAPVVLVMLLHLLPRALPEGRWTWWLQDRLLAGLVCAAVSVLLPFDLALRAVVVLLLGWAILIVPRRTGSANAPLTGSR
ncbi:hypothetical protein Y88_0804 [Novosphingobium nitrogenifigens DSM 19370]|uniref:Uncharacterized protein n=1 Tax=Novosphingobium nitrogenifigens DSM 19370 TaxID=983920 RepID=F1Z9J6_9SPHN|nr:hypothetical protein Y88_0804 [Novosphingobium nitrogenifigens DSM 19370]